MDLFGSRATKKRSASYSEQSQRPLLQSCFGQEAKEDASFEGNHARMDIGRAIRSCMVDKKTLKEELIKRKTTEDLSCYQGAESHCEESFAKKSNEKEISPRARRKTVLDPTEISVEFQNRATEFSFTNCQHVHWSKTQLPSDNISVNLERVMKELDEESRDILRRTLSRKRGAVCLDKSYQTWLIKSLRKFMQRNNLEHYSLL
eukprot:gene9764-10763_t